MALTDQLSEAIRSRLGEWVVYGELAIDGRVFAPVDLATAIRTVSCLLPNSAANPILSGQATEGVRDGEWWQLQTLEQAEPVRVERRFDWDSFWRKPEFPDLEFHASAAETLWLAAHMQLNVLLAGPQGSGKSTWAKALYALSPTPSPAATSELIDLFGDQVLQVGWRPLEKPHHSITPLAMIGGGSPLFPGVVSRAHGGVLVMDEFLEFPSAVLEALREPIENGRIEHARRGERVSFPASFQLVATTNLCPCGKLNPTPGKSRSCTHSLTRCRSVCARLSGPVMDRFDLVVMSHEWLGRGERLSFEVLRENLAASRAFAAKRGRVASQLPGWVSELELSHRRQKSLLRVARALADRQESVAIAEEHFHQAYKKVAEPMEHIRQLFA